MGVSDHADGLSGEWSKTGVLDWSLTGSDQHGSDPWHGAAALV